MGCQPCALPTDSLPPCRNRGEGIPIRNSTFAASMTSTGTALADWLLLRSATRNHALPPERKEITDLGGRSREAQTTSLDGRALGSAHAGGLGRDGARGIRRGC